MSVIDNVHVHEFKSHVHACSCAYVPVHANIYIQKANLSHCMCTSILQKIATHSHIT